MASRKTSPSLRSSSRESKVVLGRLELDWPAFADWVLDGVREVAEHHYAEYASDMPEAQRRQEIDAIVRKAASYIEPLEERARRFVSDALTLVQQQILGDALLHAFGDVTGDTKAVRDQIRGHAKASKEEILKVTATWALPTPAGRPVERSDEETRAECKRIEQEIDAEAEQLRAEGVRAPRTTATERVADRNGVTVDWINNLRRAERKARPGK